MPQIVLAFQADAIMEQKASAKIAHAKHHPLRRICATTPTKTTGPDRVARSVPALAVHDKAPEAARAETHHHGRTDDPATAAWPWFRLFPV
jgi:hypothetical protein